MLFLYDSSLVDLLKAPKVWKDAHKLKVVSPPAGTAVLNDVLMLPPFMKRHLFVLLFFGDEFGRRQFVPVLVGLMLPHLNSVIQKGVVPSILSPYFIFLI